MGPNPASTCLYNSFCFCIASSNCCTDSSDCNKLVCCFKYPYSDLYYGINPRPYSFEYYVLFPSRFLLVRKDYDCLYCSLSASHAERQRNQIFAEIFAQDGRARYIQSRNPHGILQTHGRKRFCGTDRGRLCAKIRCFRQRNRLGTGYKTPHPTAIAISGIVPRR